MATLMACYHPLRAYRGAGGAITFKEGGDSGQAMDLPCGRCIGCRIKRVQDWTARCMAEASLHDTNAFVTLTYDEQHHQPSLDYRHFQAFMRRLRRTRKVRFFCAGEYGTQKQRPHWHALLFGCRFESTFPVGVGLLGSRELTELWPYGFSSIGEVTQQSAAYVASYCVKKVTGPPAAEHYKRVDLVSGEIFSVAPELARMSLKPGIGMPWLQKYWREIYSARDSIVRPGGRSLKPPRAFDKWLAEQHSCLFTEKETERQLEALTRRDDNTPERLAVKERVAKLRQDEKKRKLL